MLSSEIYAPGKIRLIDVPEPEPAKPSGQILFQPEMGCLCGSDIPFFLKEPHYDPRPGHSLHEVVGRILDSSGTSHRLGELAMTKVPDQLGVRERIWMDENEAFPLPYNMQIEHGVLSQPLGTVVHAIRKLPSIVGATVAILGQGPMGQLFTSTVRNLGASNIICIDPIPERLLVSTKMGATHVINPLDTDPVDAVNQVTGNLGADLSIEVVGHNDLALDQCSQLCKQSGHILQFGVPPHGATPIHLQDMFRKKQTLLTSVNPGPEQDYQLAIRWIHNGLIDLKPLITHHFPVEEIQTAYEIFSGRQDGAMKVFIDFPHSGK